MRFTKPELPHGYTGKEGRAGGGPRLNYFAWMARVDLDTGEIERGDHRHLKWQELFDNVAARAIPAYTLENVSGSEYTKKELVDPQHRHITSDSIILEDNPAIKISLSYLFIIFGPAVTPIIMFLAPKIAGLSDAKQKLIFVVLAPFSAAVPTVAGSLMFKVSPASRPVIDGILPNVVMDMWAWAAMFIVLEITAMSSPYKDLIQGNAGVLLLVSSVVFLILAGLI